MEPAMNSYSSPANCAGSRGQVVQHPHLRVTLKMFDEMAADETGSARDQDVMLGSSWGGRRQNKDLRCRAPAADSFSVIPAEPWLTDAVITATR